MTLFENKIRSRLDYCRHLENHFDYYDSSSRPEIEMIRIQLNNWFSNYPKSEQNELKSRFKSTFSPAFFELFIHQMFLNLGFNVTVHPEIPNNNKRPDFLIKNNRVEFYLEAKEATDKSKKDIAKENRENQLYDFLNEFDSPNFFLKINTLDIKTHQQPQFIEIQRLLENELNSLMPDQLREKMGEKGLSVLPIIKIDNEKIFLEICPIPKSKELRGESGVRPIGAYPIHTEWGGSDISIKKSIEKKIGRYGLLDKPYIIAINSTSSKGTDNDDITNAILGSLCIQYSLNPEDNITKYTRERNGIVMGPKGPKNKRVSGFLITKVNAHNLHVAEYWLIKHPFASRPIELTNSGLSFYYLGNLSLRKQDGLSIKQIFQLDK